MFKYHKRTPQLTSSNQPIACPSDQQAGHVTHRTTSASKNSSQGLSQQLSNLQVRHGIKEIKLNSTQKIVVKLLWQLFTECTDWCWLHSLVHLLQQLVTECTDQVPAKQPWYSLPDPPPNWLQSHSTQSIQLCVDSGAGRQQVSTNMASTDWLQSLQITRPVYRLYSLIFTKTGCRVITSTIGYRACRQGTGYTTLLHQNRLQSLPN